MVWTATVAAAIMAASGTGNSLLLDCESEVILNQGYCMGVVRGTIDSLSFSSAAMPGMFCIPDGVTQGQGADVVVTYLRANPQYRHLPSTTLIIAALSKAWPCEAGPVKLLPNGGITIPEQK